MIPSGRMTRGSILDQGLQRAGNTKIKPKMREWLEAKLDELACNYEWPFLFASTTVTLAGSSFALPTTASTEFLKAQDDNGLVITAVDGQLVHHVVMEVDRELFDRLAIPTDATSNVPRIWTVDRSGTTALTWPTPLSSVVGTLRYKQRPAAVDHTNATVFDAAIPWFPWPLFLVDAVHQMALEWDSDPRASELWSMLWGRGGKFEALREAAAPRHSQPTTVALDPLAFSTPFRTD